MAQQWNHLALGVAIREEDVPALDAEDIARDSPLALHHAQLAALLQGEQVLGEERRFLTGIGFQGPLPMRVVGPVGGVGEGGHKHAVAATNHAAAHMVKVQVGEEDVGDVLSGKPGLAQATIQRVFAMQVVVAEEFLGLLVADAAVDQNQPRIDFHQKRAHRPGTEVLGIGGIGPRPKLLWNHPKHRAAIQLEIPGVNRVQSHGVKVATAPRS